MNKIYPSADYILFFDGCSKGNPGEAGIGAVIYDKSGTEIWSQSSYIGKKTNNEAEYMALISGLVQAIKSNIKQLIVFGDSQLIIKQVNNEYDVKAVNLIDFHNTVMRIKKMFEYIEFNHVLRAKNKRADQLANIGLKSKTNSSTSFSIQNNKLPQTKTLEIYNNSENIFDIDDANEKKRFEYYFTNSELKESNI
jgi:ribonuclease HI